MRLFRSEEQARQAYPQPGAIFPAEQLWRLARAWYGDRLSPDWQPRSTAESQALLEAVGLAGPFWQLAPDAGRIALGSLEEAGEPETD